MSEQEVIEMSATVFVEERESRLADEYGTNVGSGWRCYNFEKAAKLVLALDRIIAGGVTFKRVENRLKALRNSLLWAFGPEGESAYLDYKTVTKQQVNRR